MNGFESTLLEVLEFCQSSSIVYMVESKLLSVLPSNQQMLHNRKTFLEGRVTTIYMYLLLNDVEPNACFCNGKTVLCWSWALFPCKKYYRHYHKQQIWVITAKCVIMQWYDAKPYICDWGERSYVKRFIPGDVGMLSCLLERLI